MTTSPVLDEAYVQMLERIQARRMNDRPEAKTEWMQFAGWAKDDPVYDEAVRLGEAWRAGVNQKSIEDLPRQDAHP